MCTMPAMSPLPSFFIPQGAGLKDCWPSIEAESNATFRDELHAWFTTFPPHVFIRNLKDKETPDQPRAVRPSDYNRLFGIPMLYTCMSREHYESVIEVVLRAKLLMEIYPRNGEPIPDSEAQIGLSCCGWTEEECRSALELIALILETAKGACWVCLLPEGGWMDASKVQTKLLSIT